MPGAPRRRQPHSLDHPRYPPESTCPPPYDIETPHGADLLPPSGHSCTIHALTLGQCPARSPPVVAGGVCNFSTVVLCNNASRPGAEPLAPGLAWLLATRRSRLRCAPCLAALAGKSHNAITNTPQILQRVKDHRIIAPPSGGESPGRRCGSRGGRSGVPPPSSSSSSGASYRHA